jgi:hypothetical protein
VVLMRKSSNGNYTKDAENADHRIAVVFHTRFLHQHAFKQHMTIHCSNATAEFRPMTPELKNVVPQMHVKPSLNLTVTDGIISRPR